MAGILNRDYADNVARADELFEVYYLSGDDRRPLASALLEIQDFDSDGERVLNFSEADPDAFEFFHHTPQQVLTRMGDDDGREMMAYVTDRLNLAIGIYLGFLESHGVSENDAREFLEEQLLDGWLDEFTEYVDGLSKKEKGKEMMGQVERKVQVWKKTDSPPNPFWMNVLEQGEWRDTGLSSDDVKLVENAFNSVDIDPRSCHYSAQGVCRELDDDRVKYCEGFAMGNGLGRTLRHAWIELGGSVVEVTWPWHRFDGGDALYYGTAVSDDILEARVDSRGRGAEILMDDKE